MWNTATLIVALVEVRVVVAFVALVFEIVNDSNNMYMNI